MTPDDIAWVQGRLRGCKYLIATLHKCAQCLDVGDDDLLAALGFESEAALKAAYPSKLRGRGGAHRGNHAALHELEGKEPHCGVPTAAPAGDPGTNTKKGRN